MKMHRLLTASLGAIMLSSASMAMADVHPIYDHSGNVDGCGYKNDAGKVIVPVGTYDNCGEMSDGLAYVGKAELVNSEEYKAKQGFIDGTGKLVIPIKYAVEEGAEEYLYQSFSEGLVAVYKPNNDGSYGGLYGYMDKKGKMVIPYSYAYAGKFENGVAITQKDGQYGTIDKTGKTIAKARYDLIMPYSEGLAVVSLDQLYGAIDLKGKLVVPIEFDRLDYFSEGLAVYNVLRDPSDYEGTYGYIGKDGSNVINAQWSNAKPFAEGLAAVRSDDGDASKWGIINKSGKYVIKPKYDAASIELETDEYSFDDGHYKNGKMYMYNTSRSGVTRYTLDKTGNVLATKIFKDWDKAATDAIDNKLIDLNQRW